MVPSVMDSDICVEVPLFAGLPVPDQVRGVHGKEGESDRVSVPTGNRLTDESACITIRALLQFWGIEFRLVALNHSSHNPQLPLPWTRSSKNCWIGLPPIVAAHPPHTDVDDWLTMQWGVV